MDESSQKELTRLKTTLLTTMLYYHTLKSFSLSLSLSLFFVHRLRKLKLEVLFVIGAHDSFRSVVTESRGSVPNPGM